MPPVEPMLATSVPEIPTAPGMRYEPKWDGFRTIVFRDGDEVELVSRGGKTMTRYFPEVVEQVRAQLPPRCVVDGEVVAGPPGGGRHAAARLRAAAAAHPPGRVAGEDAGRDDAGRLRRVRPARARRRPI